MSKLTSAQFAAGTKYAKKDVKELKARGNIAITNTKEGSVFLSFEYGIFTVSSTKSVIYSVVIFETDCEKALINFIVNDLYIYE